MKMVLCCEVKHFNVARANTRVERAPRNKSGGTDDHNEFPLQRKDFRLK
jgi:hypothetical protein